MNGPSRRLILALLCFSMCMLAACSGLGSIPGAEDNRSVTEGLADASGADGQENAEASQQEPLPPGPSNAPGVWQLVLQMIFSLGIVILLIYLLLRFLASRQGGTMQRSGPFTVVATMPLGQGKSIMLVMIGDSLYLLGVGENIQLLRHIPAGDEMDVLLAEAEMKPASSGWLGNLLAAFRNRRENELISPDNPDQAESFEEYLQRQWNQVNNQSSSNRRWNRPDGGDRGERR